MSKVKLMIEMDKKTYQELRESFLFIRTTLVSEAVDAIQHATPITESDDCVSRKAVLDEVRAIATWHSGDAFNEDRVITHMKMLSSVIPKREQGEWIKVEDRLPEESGLYLILCREENTLHDTVEFNPYLDMYYPNSNPTSWERWSNDCYDKSKVVAWMPIPNYGEEE